jgi:hypothetical protein
LLYVLASPWLYADSFLPIVCDARDCHYSLSDPLLNVGAKVLSEFDIG